MEQDDEENSYRPQRVNVTPEFYTLMAEFK